MPSSPAPTASHAGDAARRRALALGRRLRRRLRHRAGGDRRAARARNGRGGDVELAVPARPRPDGLHRRHREPDADRGARVRARARGARRARAVRSCCCRSGRTTRMPGRRCPSRSRSSPWVGRSSTASSSRTSPADSHVASTDQDRFGHIFRRNMPYGTVTDHGTMFVGFAPSRSRSPTCWRAWPGSTRHARRAHALHARRSPAPTTSCRRSRRSWPFPADPAGGRVRR